MLIVADGLKCYLTGAALDKDSSKQIGLVANKPVFGFLSTTYQLINSIKASPRLNCIDWEFRITYPDYNTGSEQ